MISSYVVTVLSAVLTSPTFFFIYIYYIVIEFTKVFFFSNYYYIEIEVQQFQYGKELLNPIIIT